MESVNVVHNSVHDVEIVLYFVTSPLLPRGRCQVTSWNQSRSNIWITWMTTFLLNKLKSNTSPVCVRRDKGSAGCTHQWYQRECQCGANQTKMWVQLSSTFLSCVSNCVTMSFLLFFFTAIELSMPKDDAANRASVDFRIQKTQVTISSHTHTYHIPDHTTTQALLCQLYAELHTDKSCFVFIINKSRQNNFWLSSSQLYFCILLMVYFSSFRAKTVS